MFETIVVDNLWKVKLNHLMLEKASAPVCEGLTKKCFFMYFSALGHVAKEGRQL